MKQQKPALSRQLIIEEAFRVWGENFYFNTSLSSLARAMGVSKTALYRYFSGKKNLIHAMREYFLDIHQGLCEKVRAEAAGLQFEERFERFREIVIRFYAENFWFYRFLFIYFIPHSKEGFEKLKELKKFQKELIPLDQLYSELGWAKSELQIVQNYILGSGIFLLFHSSINFYSSGELKTRDVDRLDRIMVLEGFAGSAEIDGIDFQAIEAACTVQQEELSETDKIFAAIAQVVSEVGLWKASLEMIAGKAGMSKSSLYFHFKNRDEMLWEMIDRERHRVGKIFLAKSEKYETFEERLYAYFVVFSSYMNKRHDVLAAMNWFRFQGFKIQVPPQGASPVEQYVRFLVEGQQEEKLRQDIFGPLMMVQWINHFLIQEMCSTDQTGCFIELRGDVLRVLFRLFLFGVKRK